MNFVEHIFAALGGWYVFVVIFNWIFPEPAVISPARPGRIIAFNLARAEDFSACDTHHQRRT